MLLTESPVVVMPLRDDWEACGLLLAKLDESLGQLGIRDASVIIVDDRSLSDPPADFPGIRPRTVTRLKRLRLRRNMGHQRAICIALCHLSELQWQGPVIVMDSDGEDDPGDIGRLLKEFEKRNRKFVVFAERRRRSESRLFKIGYWCYRQLHWFLTGHRVRVGNFSVLGPEALATLTVSPGLWSHYAAAVFMSRMPYCAVHTKRAPRLAGASSMSVVSLTGHGLSAISVFSDVVGVRLFLLSLLAGVLTTIAILTVAAIRLFSGLAIPGWATYATGILLLLLGQITMTAVGLSLLSLRARRTSDRIPLRDYSLFVERIEELL